MTTVEKFPIYNCWTREVQFVAEIEANIESDGLKTAAAIQWARFYKVKLEGANLRNAKLSGADLGGLDLSCVNLTCADLNAAYLRNADLSGVSLSDASLSGADLSVADLSNADLSNANLSNANLGGANLSNADLRGANLCGADLHDANFLDADLSNANLNDANLGGVNLRGTDLRGTDLRGTDLRSIKSDLLAEILRLPNELEALRDAIVAGRIDGSSYGGGECACLAGTLAKARGIELYNGFNIHFGSVVFHADSFSPREQWFMNIRIGDTPENNQVAAITLDWVDEAIAIRNNIRGTAPR